MSKSSRASGLIRRFLPYYRPYRRILFASLACAVMTSASGLIFPLIVREITDRAVSDIASLTLPFILRVGGFFLLLQLLDAGCRYYMQSRGHIMGAMMEKDMRSDLFSHLSQLSFSYYSNTKVGQIMARITSDLFEVTEFAHHCPEEFLIAGVNLTVSFILLSSMNLKLTLIIFLILPVMLVSIFLFNHRMRATFRACRHQVGEINAQMEDSLLGMRVVQSLPTRIWRAKNSSRATAPS